MCCNKGVSFGQRGLKSLQTQQGRFLLRLKAVNNVLGHKGVLVDLKRETDESSKEEEGLNSAGGWGCCCSPVSLRTQTRRAAGLATPGT